MDKLFELIHERNTLNQKRHNVMAKIRRRKANNIEHTALSKELDSIRSDIRSYTSLIKSECNKFKKQEGLVIDRSYDASNFIKSIIISKNNVFQSMYNRREISRIAERNACFEEILS